MRVQPGKFSMVVFQAEILFRNPGRQCGQCSWNGSGRRPLKRTLLLVNLCSRTVLFNQEIYVFFACLSLPFHEPHWVSVLECPWSIELSRCMISILNSFFSYLGWIFLSVARSGGTWWIRNRFSKRGLMTTIQFWAFPKCLLINNSEWMLIKLLICIIA